MITRPQLWCPDDDDLSGPLLCEALSLVGVRLTPDQVEPWTYLERLIAYDWAMREHFSASDNLYHRRPKPYFVAVAEGDYVVPGTST